MVIIDFKGPRASGKTVLAQALARLAGSYGADVMHTKGDGRTGSVDVLRVNIDRDQLAAISKGQAPKAEAASHPGYPVEWSWMTENGGPPIWTIGNRFRVWREAPSASRDNHEWFYAENRNWATPEEVREDWSNAFPIDNEIVKAAFHEVMKPARSNQANYLHRLIRNGEGEMEKLLLKWTRHHSALDVVTIYADDIRACFASMASRLEASVEREEKLAAENKLLRDRFELFRDNVDHVYRQDDPRHLPMSYTRIDEMLDYATVYGAWDENTPSGDATSLALEKMDDARRSVIWTLKRVLGILPEDAPRPEPQDRKPPVFKVMFNDIGPKLAEGLRQVRDDMTAWAEASKWGRSNTPFPFIDRIAGYAAELEEANRVKSRPIARMATTPADIYGDLAENLNTDGKRSTAMLRELGEPYGKADPVLLGQWYGHGVYVHPNMNNGQRAELAERIRGGAAMFDMGAGLAL